MNEWLNVSKNVATISPCPALNIFRVYATIPHIYKYIRKQRYSGNYPEIQNWNFCEKSEKGLITAWDFSQKFTKKIHTVKFCVVIKTYFYCSTTIQHHLLLKFFSCSKYLSLTSVANLTAVTEQILQSSFLFKFLFCLSRIMRYNWVFYAFICFVLKNKLLNTVIFLLLCCWCIIGRGCVSVYLWKEAPEPMFSD